MHPWDLIVIGVGAVGSAALRAASEAGARVLGLEQFEPANLRGSSHGHSRIFRHAYFEHPDYVPLLRHSTARLESLERESGAALLHRCGMLVAGPRDSRAVQGSLESSRRWGLEVEALEGASLDSRFPWFDFPAGTFGALESNAGVVRPEATLRATVHVASTRGAVLRGGARVRAIAEDSSGVSVETDGGRERAEAVVVSAGPWAAQLLPELAARLTVTRQVQAWFMPCDGVDASAMPCWFYDRGPRRRPIYGLAPDPLVVAGSSDATCPGRWPKAGLHGSDDVVDPDVGAPPVTAADLERLQEACRKVAPKLAGEIAASATCLYTMTPDENFLVGTRAGSRRVHFAAGLSGHGFKLGPALGDALVGLALHGRTDLPIGFLSPRRFG
jgi:sarcosine oxidase